MLLFGFNKDDGCNRNIVSSSLVKHNRQNVNVVKEKCTVQPSKEFLTGKSSKVILERMLKTVSHTYATNWVVSDFRYHVLWRMSWHV